MSVVLRGGVFELEALTVKAVNGELGGVGIAFRGFEAERNGRYRRGGRAGETGESAAYIFEGACKLGRAARYRYGIVAVSIVRERDFDFIESYCLSRFGKLFFLVVGDENLYLRSVFRGSEDYIVGRLAVFVLRVGLAFEG